MAKMKTYAVEVEVTIKMTLYVDARRPNGAAERLMTQDGWSDATRYAEDYDPRTLRSDAKVMKIREVS